MCEKLQALLEQAQADGNVALIAALEQALSAAGCPSGVVTADSGGTGRPGGGTGNG